jgi:hypothetical protein
MADQVRKQAAANRAAAEMHDFKRMVLEALQDPEFRSEFWRALATDARSRRATETRTGRPPAAANTEQARSIRAVKIGR